MYRRCAELGSLGLKFESATAARAGRGPRALTYNSLRLFQAGHDCIREVSMAKLLTQRAVRHARLGPIGGGTDEIMKEIIGRQMGL